ncbi:MAG TPA: lipid II flippase MurJ [Acidimicrobiia bacterium]|nr:lipid II flippase MurJ [Acidimicrobiia bacterium]
MVEPVAGTQSVSRSAAGMGVATAVSRGFGFVRVLAIAAILGTTYLGNTFTSSNYVSNVLFELLAAGALSAVLVPTLVERLEHGDQAEAERLAGGILGRALLGLGVVTIAGVAAAPLLARLLASGVESASIAEQQRELATFLLRFFVPQVLLYALGTVAIAVLYAKRRFVITAIAPIGNTIMIVAGLVVFRLLAGDSTELDLSSAEKLVLALSGTLGVAAFVGIPALALRRTGFRLRPRLGRGDAAVSRLMRLSGWAILQHAQIGLLLGAAIVLGNSVEGGTVAYQVAWVFFLAPYGVLAQPIHTAILPELSLEATRHDLDAFARSLRWSLDAMAMLVVPVSAAMIALGRPGMIVVAFGEAADNGVDLLTAGVASLAIGLFPYGAFLLLARAYYALGDSRTPAVVAIATGIVGVIAMGIGALVTDGAARVAALGIGHTIAYVTGCVVLCFGLSRRTGHAIVPAALPKALTLSAVLGAAGWWIAHTIDPSGRLENAALVVAIAVGGAALYLLAVRVTGGRVVRGRVPDPEVSELEPDSAEVEA